MLLRTRAIRLDTSFHRRRTNRDPATKPMGGGSRRWAAGRGSLPVLSSVSERFLSKRLRKLKAGASCDLGLDRRRHAFRVWLFRTRATRRAGPLASNRHTASSVDYLRWTLVRASAGKAVRIQYRLSSQTVGSSPLTLSQGLGPLRAVQQAERDDDQQRT